MIIGRVFPFPTATTVLLTLASLAGPWFCNSPRAAAAVKKDVAVTLKITDKVSGFTREAKKLVAADSNAFDFLRHTVALTYKTDVDGVPAPPPSVRDGRHAPLGARAVR